MLSTYLRKFLRFCCLKMVFAESETRSFKSAVFCERHIQNCKWQNYFVATGFFGEIHILLWHFLLINWQLAAEGFTVYYIACFFALLNKWSEVKPYGSHLFVCHCWWIVFCSEWKWLNHIRKDHACCLFSGIIYGKILQLVELSRWN